MERKFKIKWKVPHNFALIQAKVQIKIRAQEAAAAAQSIFTFRLHPVLLLIKVKHVDLA